MQLVNNINKYFIVLLGFFIPISTAMTNILIGLILLFWILDNIIDRFNNFFLILKSNPVAFMGLVVFLIYLVGILYTNAERKDILEYLRDGAKFAFIPISMIYFKDEKFHPFFISGFICAMIVTLLLSWLLWLDLIPGIFPVKGSQQDCTIFFNHITQNMLMAYTTFILAVWARFSPNIKARFVWGILSLGALLNTLLLVGGRTGYLVTTVLFFYFFLTWKSVKSIAVALAVILSIGAVTWLYPSNSLFIRTAAMIKEIKLWNHRKSAVTSSGLRLEFYLNSLKVIKKSPFLGTGTGSFKKTYYEIIEQTDLNKTDNPHNDYLMMAVQFGIVGLLALLGFFMTQWRYAVFLKTRSDILLSRGFILTILCSCMVSSPLTDSAEGWFFAFMSAFFFSSLDKEMFLNVYTSSLKKD